METQPGILVRCAATSDGPVVIAKPKTGQVRLFYVAETNTLEIKDSNGNVVVPNAAISEIFHDSTLTGQGTASSPLSVVASGGVGIAKFTKILTPSEVNDIVTNNNPLTILIPTSGKAISTFKNNVKYDFGTIAYSVNGDAGGSLILANIVPFGVEFIISEALIESASDSYSSFPGSSSNNYGNITNVPVVLSRASNGFPASINSLGDGNVIIDIYYTEY